MQPDRSCSVQTSIVVVTFNNRAEIDACLRSLQAHSTDAEIIVVDNLSSDGTLDYVQRQHPHVRAISANRNDGFGAGVNLGARMASGTFLAVVSIYVGSQKLAVGYALISVLCMVIGTVSLFSGIILHSVRALLLSLLRPNAVTEPE